MYTSCVLKLRITFLISRVLVKHRLFILYNLFPNSFYPRLRKRRRRRVIRKEAKETEERFSKYVCIEPKTSSNLLLSQDHGRSPCFIYAIVNIGVILRKVVTPQNHNYVWVLFTSRHVRCHASRVASVTA